MPTMRAVVQRVSSASVVVDGATVAEINETGLLALVGVTHTDTREQAAKLAGKLWNLRILPGEKSCSDVGAPIIVVSQFTLYGDARKGRRPSFVEAAPPEIAIPLYERFIDLMRERLPGRVATGEFGAMMDVELVNEGPVTLILER